MENIEFSYHVSFNGIQIASMVLGIICLSKIRYYRSLFTTASFALAIFVTALPIILGTLPSLILAISPATTIMSIAGIVIGVIIRFYMWQFDSVSRAMDHSND